MLEQNRNNPEPASVSQPVPIASEAVTASAMPSLAPMALSDLRQAVARIESAATDLQTPESAALTFGIPSLDHALAGGLAPASLHEVTPDGMGDRGSAIGFTLALAARAHNPGKALFWITTDFAALEAGETYGLGCDLAGVAARDLVVVKAARPIDALWAMEEALKCRALSAVVAELPNDAPLADLTATRRLTLAAREGGAFGFLLRHRASALTSSAETRWRVAAAPALPDRFGGLGRASFSLTLHKNRRGPTGHWPIAWNHHERAFEALSLGVAAAAPDRQDRAPLRSAG
jgi:protein ImuA